MTAVVGGAKISDKMAMLEHMVDQVQALLIGGGMAATFLKARGLEPGMSLLEPDKVEFAAKLEQRARERGVALLLPSDLIVGERFEADAPSRTVDAEAIPVDWTVMDIGPKTIALFQDELKKSKTVLWNGPMGVFRDASLFRRYASGSRVFGGPGRNDHRRGRLHRPGGP